MDAASRRGAGEPIRKASTGTAADPRFEAVASQIRRRWPRHRLAPAGDHRVDRPAV